MSGDGVNQKVPRLFLFDENFGLFGDESSR
jgi:hypothetical protein